MRVPVRFSPETALCGNTHLVVAPGRERQETERVEGAGGGQRGCYVVSLLFPFTMYSRLLFIHMNTVYYTFIEQDLLQFMTILREISLNIYRFFSNIFKI